MAVIKKKFQSYTLEEDKKEKMLQVNNRLNHKEQQWLEALKLLHNTPKGSTAFKNEAFRVFKQMEFLEQIKKK